MIKSLKQRVQEEINHLSSELSIINDVDHPSNYNKLTGAINSSQKRLRQINLELSNQKDQCHE